MDSNLRLRYLSWNLVLMLETISSSSSSFSQIIRGTSQPTHASGLLLEDKENKDNEEDEVDDEDEELGDRVLTLWTERAAIFFF